MESLKSVGEDWAKSKNANKEIAEGRRNSWRVEEEIKEIAR
jgi:hypothetical protein